MKKQLENIITELKVEILKPHHNTSGFQSENKQLEEYLQKEAIHQQECHDKVTHLVIYDDEIIGYFSLQVYPDGIPSDDYEKILNTTTKMPERNRVPLVELKRFCMAEGYEHYKLIESIIDNVIYNIKKIFHKYDVDGVAISIPPTMENLVEGYQCW